MPTLHPSTVSSGYVTFLAIAGVFSFLSAVSVSIRFLQRRIIRNVWWDDWSILASLILAFGVLITTALVATLGGAGYHIQTYSIPQLETYIKVKRVEIPFYFLHRIYTPVRLTQFCQPRFAWPTT